MGGFTALFHFGPYIALVLTLLGGWGLWEEHKLDQAKLGQQQGVIDQANKDRAESARQIGILQTKLENIDVRIQPIIQRIVTAPQTAGCGPSVRIALDGVRELRAGAGPANAGPKPAQPPGMPAAHAPAVDQPKR
jgi:hypothetical protein